MQFPSQLVHPNWKRLGMHICSRILVNARAFGKKCSLKSSFSEQLFLERVVQPNCDRARLTLLLSQSGGAASAWLRAVPSEPAFTLRPLRFQLDEPSVRDSQKSLNVVAKCRAHAGERTWRDAYQNCMDVMRTFH